MPATPSICACEELCDSQPVLQGDRERQRFSSGAPADEAEQQGGIPLAGERHPGFSEYTPVEQFRFFMLEKFRELDDEFQRVMALEPMHREQIHTSATIDIDLVKIIPIHQTLGDSSIRSKPVHGRVQTNPGDLAEADAERKMQQPALDGGDEENQPRAVNVVSGVSKVSPASRSLSSPSYNAEHAPQNAFVINVRRLINTQENLTLLHEILNSTAIAAITLVAAGTANQFIATLLFLLVVFALYALHEQDWDRLEIEDIKMLLPLICDDSDPNYVGPNPNRILKAITVSRSRFLPRLFHLFDIAVFVSLTLAWLMLEYRWRNPGDVLGEEDSIAMWMADTFLKGEEDSIAMGMQITVATLMFLLKVTFEYIHWRETSAVMPCKGQGEAWDPRRHGTPAQFWLFGMPSMWFTSEDALEKLKRYIEMASPSSKAVRNIYPQELAYYALEGDDERAELQRALNHCKLFDGCCQSIIFDVQSRTAQPLALDLCFFDDRLQHKSFPYPGEFTYYRDGEADDPAWEASRPSRMVHAEDSACAKP